MKKLLFALVIIGGLYSAGQLLDVEILKASVFVTMPPLCKRKNK